MDRAEVRATELVAGRYELERELARGGMGVVFRALDRTTGATVALKRSLEEREEASQTNRSLLRREYQTLITLRHPRIIQVYDFGVDEVGPYYTMELLDGVDLRSKCPLPWREACSHLRDIASSLALLHSRRLIHCDVSVANVRLTQEGRAKLLDFGTLASFGRNAMIAGTPPMMAPEVLAHQELDQRVDLYALGATAYYALTGEHAYPVSMVALLPPAWAAGRPAPPSKYAPDVPRELDELVLSLLDLDRMSRPASAAEVIDRLGAIAELAPDEDQRVQRSYLHAAEVAGRDSERALLEDKLKHALSGRGSGVLIEGAAGMGKTFLLEDIARQARMAGARVITVNARAHNGPYSTWSALLREA
ncbi:MAG TPA: serine/threonine-protein kinase, partial [Polyangiales bacterium]